MGPWEERRDFVRPWKEERQDVFGGLVCVLVYMCIDLYNLSPSAKPETLKPMFICKYASVCQYVYVYTHTHTHTHTYTHRHTHTHTHTHRNTHTKPRPIYMYHIGILYS